MRRSRADIALARKLRIGDRFEDQSWGDIWTVRQVHRADCTVELEREGRRRELTIARLRGRHWRPAVDAIQEIAA